MSLFLAVFVVSPILASADDAKVLKIEATYQADDFNISTDAHQQCLAWNLYWKTQNRRVDLTTSDIDLLASRRAEVAIRNENDARRFGIPPQLLTNYSYILVDFHNICRLLPRVLKIGSPLAARKNRINLSSMCESVNETVTEIKLDDVDDANANDIGIDYHIFRNHASIIIELPNACNENASDANEAVIQYYLEKYGDFSYDIKNLGMDVEKLHELVRKTEELDEIMSHAADSCKRPLPSSTILPFLQRVEYDPRQPPALHIHDTVTVKVGLFIQSMSNFELSTMDYDLDTWLRMAWIDPRLRHGLSRPILVNDFTFLKLIWRPDPIFTNSKSATFHKVSYLNFYLLIFPDGKVFMDVRVYLKPTAAQIVLCKYPHDNPAVSLKISSMGFTQDVVRFEWFANRHEAIKIEKNVQIPELKIRNIMPEECNGVRKSGNYSCLEAKFQMHREIGYHIANTYIPSTICVVFSWISVWLPEEFVEGRIFVSLTVFLTLSAENNSAKEELPKVSYVKAIDIWFGFTSTFVFMTMLQALVVISLEHNSKRLKLKCERNLEGYGKYQLTKSLLLSRYYHKLARQVDTFCKVMYPVIFALFLMFYSFVITQGDEKKCLQNN
ncbi:unnamed protein product [Caenorhabditis bovis]|uniref:Uncharacterized protein n=1 Tax=Caenorhabditis bovis TaxID=2654633 RepID=A0A8S1ECT0_9PELO|nr:unnamed protein product [Caenorhabditis bovis]